MLKGVKRFKKAIVLAASMGAIAQAAAAQESNAPPVDGSVSASEDDQLGEIIVTARRRAENLQDTPIAVTALGGEALLERQVTNLSEVGKFAPNVNFESASPVSGSSNSAVVFIRGIGQTDFNLTIDPGVGIYLDGVYISRSVGALLDTADVEQVQILRGPQGDLFGKNTIGGAVVLTSRQPSDTFDAFLEATTGRFERMELKGGINVPLSDAAAVRASVSYQRREGYGRRLSDGGDTGDKDSLSGRIAARFELGGDWSVTAALDGTRAREHQPPFKVLALNEFGFFPIIYNNFGPGAAAGCVQFGPSGPPTPTSANNANCYNAQWLTNSPYTNYNNEVNRSDLDVWGASLTLNHEGDAFGFKSISAYRDLKSFFVLESDGSPLRVTNTTNDYSQWQASQEFQFSGDLMNDRLKWLLGLYYLKEKGTDRNRLFPGANQPIGFLSGGTVDNDSFAVFAQSIFSITPELRLTLGGRYTDETKRFLPDQYVTSISPAVSGFLGAVGIVDFNGDGGPLQVGDRLLPFTEGQTKASEFTPAVTLDYQFEDGPLLYARYSKGFKSGGFTQRVFPPLTSVPSFRPEFAESYELGFKSELFDRRFRLNGAAFYTDYTDLQTVVVVFIAPVIQNAGKARIKGFELEAEGVLADWLRVNGAVGYTDAKYREVPASAAPVTVNSRLPETPKWTANAGVTADLFQTSAGRFSVRGDWSYRSGHFKDAVNSPTLFQEGYSLLSASATFTTADDRWAISAGVTNLTDKKYLLTGFADLPGAGNSYGIFGRPQEWFLRVRYSI